MKRNWNLGNFIQRYGHASRARETTEKSSHHRCKSLNRWLVTLFFELGSVTFYNFVEFHVFPRKTAEKKRSSKEAVKSFLSRFSRSFLVSHNPRGKKAFLFSAKLIPFILFSIIPHHVKMVCRNQNCNFFILSSSKYSSSRANEITGGIFTSPAQLQSWWGFLRLSLSSS